MYRAHHTGIKFKQRLQVILAKVACSNLVVTVCSLFFPFALSDTRQPLFRQLALKNLLFNRASGQKAVNEAALCLPVTPHASGSLLVVRRVLFYRETKTLKNKVTWHVSQSTTKAVDVEKIREDERKDRVLNCLPSQGQKGRGEKHQSG
jgi:hypothetical protein